MPFTRRNWSHQPWLLLSREDLRVELAQAAEEGKALAEVMEEFEALLSADLIDEVMQRRAEAMLDQIQALPQVAGYVYHEPSDLADIQAARPVPVTLPERQLSDELLFEKALGGWRGRACGCLLGKPVEGRRAWQIEKYLTAQGRWPLDRYFSAQAPEEIIRECEMPVWNSGLFEEDITCMVEDDDTNYTVTGLAILAQRGHDFTPEDVAAFWLQNIPIFHVCTAERIAYRNLVQCIPPPASAAFRNVYREWIGAQIRADFWGYVCPGDPARAAAYAWRDAAISHVKNGIYGEMWVAAMLAAAYVCDDIATVIRAGLAQIPARSRLTEAITRVLAQHAAGLSYDDAIEDLGSRWNEDNGHHWCHIISNAEIVAIALLWGEKDFGRTICAAVMPGFDTDCNGATAGSVLGAMLGARHLPNAWTAPLHDTLLTGVAGYHRVTFTSMTEQTVALMARG